MTRLRALALSAAAAALCMLSGLQARGAARSCEALTIEAEPAVLASWPSLPKRIEEALKGREDIERCARVRLQTSGADITLEVILEDGRSAVRRVSAQRDVLVALDALLLVPTHQAKSRGVEPQKAKVARPSALATHHGRGQAAPAPESPPLTRARGVRTGTSENDAPMQPGSESTKDAVIHLGVVGGARVGDGQVSETLGALSFLEISSWIFSLDGRAANYEGAKSSSDATSMSTLELATLGGRRFNKTTPGVDVTAGPSIVLQQTDNVETGPEGTTRTTTSRVVPRFSFAGRLHMFAQSAVSGFIGLEGIVALPGAETSDGPAGGPPPLPVWMVGLSVGATVGIR